MYSGFCDYGDVIPELQRVYGNTDKSTALATKVLQFIFNGVSGFKYPVCHYPITGITAADLTLLIDQVITALAENHFQVRTGC